MQQYIIQLYISFSFIQKSQLHLQHLLITAMRSHLVSNHEIIFFYQFSVTTKHILIYVRFISHTHWYFRVVSTLRTKINNYSYACVPVIVSIVQAQACFFHTPKLNMWVRSACRWCKLQIFCLCSRQPQCLYSQPALQPPQSSSHNLITCFICTSLYFNQGLLCQQRSPAGTCPDKSIHVAVLTLCT